MKISLGDFDQVLRKKNGDFGQFLRRNGDLDQFLRKMAILANF
jgi:hypothetical protein